MTEEIRHNVVVKNPSPTLTGAPARVARVLLESGPASASSLGKQLELTGTAVRRHLDYLVEAGFAEASETAPFGPSNNKPRGRGRPAKVYTLTAAGRSAFDQGYDDLAIALLRHLQDVGGDPAVVEFARKRATDLERRYATALTGADTVEDRAIRLAEAMREDGFASTAERSSERGVQVCQHNCPIAEVAEEFPQLCDAETEAFSKLIGTHVTRLATLSHGDGVCTTHVPIRIVHPDHAQLRRPMEGQSA